MALRTLVYSPFFDEYEKQAQQLADGIVSLIDATGRFKPWFIEPEYEYDADYLLTFYSGEAILSLLEYYQRTQQDEYFQAVCKAQHWYLTQYVDQLESHYYPAYVPWHTLSLSKLYELEPNARYAQAIFRPNDELLKILDRTDHVGRFYNPRYPQYGQPHSSADGIYTESLLYAWEMARRIADSASRSALCPGGTARAQSFMRTAVQGSRARFFCTAGKVYRRLAHRARRLRIRLDTTQHAMDAFRKYVELTNHRERACPCADGVGGVRLQACRRARPVKSNSSQFQRMCTRR